MTAINVVVRPDKAFLMTDAAYYDRDGNIHGFGPKILPIPGLHCALAVRGSLGVGTHMMGAMAMRYSSFDDLADRAEADLRDFAAMNAPGLTEVGFAHFDLTIVGWSARLDRPRAFSFHNQPGGFAEGELQEIERFSVSPDPEEHVWRDELRYVGVDLSQFDRLIRHFDPGRHGVPIMEAQRRMVDAVSDVCDRQISLVGGHLVAAEIDRDGLSFRVLHRWSDVPGQEIKPAPFVKPFRLHDVLH